MKIVENNSILSEAFDASAPEWIRKFLSRNTAAFRGRRPMAGNIINFDASTAVFEDVSTESVSALRSRLKSNEDVLFFLISNNPYNSDTLMVTYDPSNKSNGLNIVGSSQHQYTSFKKLVEMATEIYYTKITTNRADKRSKRRQSRQGLISRDNDSAQPSDFRSSYDGSNWVKDASGYTYDANRLSKKLIQLHDGDAAFLVRKSSSLFKAMAEDYAEKIKSFSQDTKFDLGTFNRTGFEYIIREGQRLLSNTAQKLNELNDGVETYSIDLETYNNMLTSRDREPVDDEAFQERREDIFDRMGTYFNDIKANKLRMDKILAGKDED